MDGARLILNARYFHIAQTGEKATKYAFVAEAAAGLVNYIATRESVIYNYDEHYKEVSATEAQREAINQFLEVSPDLELSREFKAYDEDRSAANASALISRAAQYVYGMTAEGDVKPSAPATRAQRERIQEFVNKVPAIRQTPEYSDYKASPTRENASEVLSHALEVGLANAADPETLEIMLNYIAERPGVVHNEGKVHGLFTVNGAADLAAEKEAIAAHTGNIYSMVFSLRREDADRLGYDRQDAWSQLFAIKADKIAQALRVPTSKLHWVAAVHNTKHHPHAHFIAYSTEQKSRIYLSEDAIEQLKSEFVSEIFAEERHQIFAPREEARQQLEDRLETLFTQLEHNSNAAVTDLLLPEKLAALRKSIESASGRHVYKYLPKDTKAMVDKLLDEISEVPEIKELLTEYNKYQQQLEAYYKTPDEPKPLSAATTRSNLYPLKNLVVQYALQFEPSPPLTPKTENSSAKTGSTSGFSYSDALDEPENAQMNEPFKATWKTNDIRSWRDNMKVQSSSPPYDGTAEEKYRYAQYLRYDEKCPQDAILWYNLAEQLGQLMQRIDGDATEIYAHYAAARVGMLYAEEHRPTSATAQQAVRLATMYRYGLGCDADHETAVHWYTVAAERGSIYAQQRLEVMEMQRIRQEQRAAEYAEKQQQQQNLSFAARLLNTIGNALCRQTLRDQQSATATTDRKQRRMQRRLKRALGQKEDYEQIFQ